VPDLIDGVRGNGVITARLSLARTAVLLEQPAAEVSPTAFMPPTDADYAPGEEATSSGSTGPTKPCKSVQGELPSFASLRNAAPEASWILQTRIYTGRSANIVNCLLLTPLSLSKLECAPCFSGPSGTGQLVHSCGREQSETEAIAAMTAAFEAACKALHKTDRSTGIERPFGVDHGGSVDISFLPPMPHWGSGYVDWF
jgi:hypothetical protein